MEKKVTKKTTKTAAKKAVPKKEDNMKGLTKLFNLFFLQYMGYSMIFLIAGFVLLTEPAMATRTAEIITACILFVLGLGNAFNYSLKSRIRIFDFSLVFSAISLILGVLIITNPFALTNFLSVAFGVFLIINGLLKINFALNFKSVKEDSWVLVLTMAIVSFLFGAAIIVNPFANLYFTQVIGMFMILYAIIELTHTILLKQRSKVFLKLLK